MSQVLQHFNLAEFMTRHLIEVFDTMLSMKASPLESTELVRFPERVSGSVGLAGETVTGAVYLHLTATFANRLAAAMLALPPGQTPAERDVNDAVGEATNMLAGGLKSALCDNGAPCAVSTPAVIRGTSFVIEPFPEVRRFVLHFQCDGERLSVEVHIKTN